MNSYKLYWFNEIKISHLRLVWDYLDNTFENSGYDIDTFHDVFDMINNNGNV